FGFALRLRAAQRAAVFPCSRVGRAAAVGVFRRLADPEPAALIPIEIHDLVDKRLGRDEVDRELGMDLDFSRSFRGSGRSALGITERIAEFAGDAELVDIFPLSSPGDAAEEDGAIVGTVEVFVE